MSDQPPEGPQFNPQSGFPVPPPAYDQGQYPQQYPPQYQQPQYGYPQQPYPQQQPYPYPYGGYPARPEWPQATTALVLGLVAVVGAFFTCGLTLFVAPFAWVVGAKARNAIDASNGQYDGRSKATTGFVMGIVGTVLLVLGLILTVVIIVAAVNGEFDETVYYDDSNVSATTVF